jgi:hypothetical protein
MGCGGYMQGLTKRQSLATVDGGRTIAQALKSDWHHSSTEPPGAEQLALGTRPFPSFYSSLGRIYTEIAS